MLIILQNRAETLIWTIEGSARAFAKDANIDFTNALTEMGRQPGVAWIALVNEQGKIIMDSTPDITGNELYTAKELNELAPESYIKSRFTPDEPDIFETWKIFSPNIHHGKPLYIFAAIEASDFRKNLKRSSQEMLIETLLGAIAIFSTLSLVYYIINYKYSRLAYHNVQALAIQVIQNYPGVLFTVGDNGIINLFNKQAGSLLNIPKKGANIASLSGMDWIGIIKEVKRNGAVFNLERELLVSDEKQISVSLSCSKIKNAQGKETGFLFILKDIDEIKALKEKLAESQHLMAIGKLAAGLAHEIRNPLSTIRGYASLLQQRLKNSPVDCNAAAILEEESERLNNVVTDLLAATRKPELNKISHSIPYLVDRCYLLVSEDAKSRRIILQKEIKAPENAPNVYIDKDKMLQALLNLTLNAIQASPAGASVVIEACYNAKNNCWIISVKDHGKGMHEDILSQIFSPYFTTRKKGTGLGLTITRQIIESHGSHISVASIPEKGSIFSFEIKAEKK